MKPLQNSGTLFSVVMFLFTSYKVFYNLPNKIQNALLIAAVFVARKGHVKNGIFAFDVVITLLKLIVTIFAYPTERSVCDISNSKCQICRIEPSKCSSDQ